MTTTKTILEKARDALSPMVLYLSARERQDDEFAQDCLTAVADFLGWLEDIDRAEEEGRK